MPRPLFRRRQAMLQDYVRIAAVRDALGIAGCMAHMIRESSQQVGDPRRVLRLAGPIGRFFRIGTEIV